MANKKEKLIDKIIKKDYKNELEEVLAKKNFEENAKNLLLDIIYKVDNAYNDYKTVKVNVMPKDQYIQNLINIIRKKCDSIKLVSPHVKNELGENRTFKINYEKKEIICYPIERKLLYALSKIQKSEDIIKDEGEFLNRTLTDLINIGNNINMVEPLRDFNGFSWNISTSEIENIFYNLIYQDLIILVGNDFLEEWTNKNELIIDYMALFQDELEKRYNKKIAKNTITLLKKLSVLLELSINKEIVTEIKRRKTYLQHSIKEMSNSEEFLENISANKKKLEKQIKKIDLILNSRELLKKEYKKRNEKLSLEQKIFSTRVLSQKLKEEREESINKITEYNILMNPKKMQSKKEEFKEEYDYLSLVDLKNYEEKIIENFYELQKVILRSFKIKIEKSETKAELLKTMYEFRYFYLLPITREQKQGNSPKLSRLENIVLKSFLDKANELKVINKVFKDQKHEIEILKKIFSLQIISLDDIYLKITKNGEKFEVQFYDEDIYDEKFAIDLELNKEDFNIKLNKKVKFFIG